MKRTVSILIIVMLILANAVVFAAEDIVVEVTKNEVSGNSYSFEVVYSIESVKKGDILTISTPFPVNIDGKDIFTVEQVSESTYNLIANDDYINIKGKVGGTKTINSTSELNPLVIDGRVVIEDYPEIVAPEGPVATERDRIYKHGEIEGNVINWTVTIGGDEKGVSATKITDEIGNGHEYVEGSLHFNVISHGEYTDELVDMIIKDVDTSYDEINIETDTISPNEILLINYQTRITDDAAREFSNQVIVENEKKVTETVTIDDYSDLDGEKPDRPNLPELPQVGESIVKTEFILGIILIIAAVLIRKGR